MKIHISSKQIPDDKLFKICTAMPKWNFEEYMSGNNSTLISYVDLPLIFHVFFHLKHFLSKIVQNQKLLPLSLF